MSLSKFTLTIFYIFSIIPVFCSENLREDKPLTPINKCIDIILYKPKKNYIPEEPSSSFIKGQLFLEKEELDIHKTIFIGMLEYSVTSDENDRYVIATHGLCGYIGVCIYDPILRKAALMHASEFIDYEKWLPKVTWQVCGSSRKKETQIWLISRTQRLIDNYSKNFLFMGFSKENFKNFNINARNIAINVKTGLFFSYEYNHQKYKSGDEYRRTEKSIASMYSENLNFIKS